MRFQARSARKMRFFSVQPGLKLDSFEQNFLQQP